MCKIRHFIEEKKGLNNNITHTGLGTVCVLNTCTWTSLTHFLQQHCTVMSGEHTVFAARAGIIDQQIPSVCMNTCRKSSKHKVTSRDAQQSHTREVQQLRNIKNESFLTWILVSEDDREGESPQWRRSRDSSPKIEKGEKRDKIQLTQNWTQIKK